MGEDDLRALAERVMALTGPDREVDAEIAIALGIGGNTVAMPGGWCAGGPAEQPFLSPAFTVSLDAAIALLKSKRWHWRKLTADSISVYRSDITKTASERFSGYGPNDACRMVAAYLLALADSMDIAEKSAAALLALAEQVRQ